ncbi:MAG: hypothetical protein ABSF72_08655 [Candidatus Sulfotelmatobacter sp.]
MGALSIAFDIIIVGALALPWVLLVLRLFFSDDEHTVEKHFDWVKNQKQPALAGVLLFAMTYSLGSAVSRIAQDFFDDDDLYLHASHYLFRVGVTESSIRANVFCNAFRDAETATPSEPPPAKQEPSKTPQEPGNPTAAKHQRFKDNNPDCKYTGRWIVQTYNPDTQERIPVSPGAHEYVNANWINRQEELAQDIFQYQEAAVLLQGTDATERIRQYHDQIMVLRGAAFNSLIAFSLCLFWWSSQSLAGLGWALSFFYAFLGFLALSHHLSETPLTDPPYMEFTLLVLMAAGWYILSRYAPKKKRGQPKLDAPKGRMQTGYIGLAAFLMVAASLGWWATQVLYDQELISSYQALTQEPAKSAKK